MAAATAVRAARAQGAGVAAEQPDRSGLARARPAPHAGRGRLLASRAPRGARLRGRVRTSAGVLAPRRRARPRHAPAPRRLPGGGAGAQGRRPAAVGVRRPRVRPGAVAVRGSHRTGHRRLGRPRGRLRPGRRPRGHRQPGDRGGAAGAVRPPAATDRRAQRADPRPRGQPAGGPGPGGVRSRTGRAPDQLQRCDAGGTWRPDRDRRDGAAARRAPRAGLRAAQRHLVRAAAARDRRGARRAGPRAPHQPGGPRAGGRLPARDRRRPDPGPVLPEPRDVVAQQAVRVPARRCAGGQQRAREPRRVPARARRGGDLHPGRRRRARRGGARGARRPAPLPRRCRGSCSAAAVLVVARGGGAAGAVRRDARPAADRRGRRGGRRPDRDDGTRCRARGPARE